MEGVWWGCGGWRVCGECRVCGERGITACLMRKYGHHPFFLPNSFMSAYTHQEFKEWENNITKLTSP